MAANYTVHWWDGFNREHQAKDPLEKREAEADLKLRVKKGAVRGEVRDGNGTRILAYERGETGLAMQTYPLRKQGG